jgi:hypothetical protein
LEAPTRAIFLDFESIVRSDSSLFRNGVDIVAKATVGAFQCIMMQEAKSGYKRDTERQLLYDS